MMLSVHVVWRKWLPVVIWMGLIFCGSTDHLSHAQTSRFIEPLLRWVFGCALSADAIDQVHFLIRKSGHLCEYAVLCVLLWRAVESSGGNRGEAGYPAGNPGAVRGKRLIAALLLTAAYAATDEFHQSFVPSRGASVNDVLLDTAGAIGGLLLYFALGAAWLRFSRRKGASLSSAAAASRPTRDRS